MAEFIIPLARRAADAERVGPKAANLAALGRRGPADAGRLLPERRMPTGRRSRRSGSTTWSADSPLPTRPSSGALSVEIRLALYEQPIAPQILEPLLAAWDGAARRGAARPARCAPRR